MSKCFACFGFSHKRNISEDMGQVQGQASTQSYHEVDQSDSDNVIPTSISTEEDWDAGKCRGLGEVCQVCCGRIATHMAVPCSHTACGACWETWQAKKNAQCMICGGGISLVKRASFQVVPESEAERARRIGPRLCGGASWILQAEMTDQILEQALRRPSRAFPSRL